MNSLGRVLGASIVCVVQCDAAEQCEGWCGGVLFGFGCLSFLVFFIIFLLLLWFFCCCCC